MRLVQYNLISPMPQMIPLFRAVPIGISTLCLTLASVGANANSLLDIYLLALDNDAQFKSVQASLRAEGEQLGVARAALLPQLSADGEYRESEGEVEQGGGIINSIPSVSAGKIDTEQEYESYSVSLQQKLFSAPDWFEYKRARNLRKRAQTQFQYERQNLIVRVAQAYFDVLRAAEELNFGRAEENAVFRQMQRTQNRFNSGLATATDALEARSAHDLIKAQSLLLEEQLSNAREALGVITGIVHETLRPLKDDFPVKAPEPEALQPWIDRTLKNNYQLRAANISVAAARAALNAQRGAHLPTLSGSASRGRSEDDSLGIFGRSVTETDDDSFGVQLQIPLFTGGRLSAERRIAYQNYLQAKADFRQTRRQITQQLRALLKAQKIAVVRVQAHRQAVRSAERALLSIRNGYETGIRDLVNVLDAEKNWYQARSNLHNVRIDYLIDNIELQRVSGELDESHLSLINDWLKP